jgi:large subunit ribosomal protein L13
MKSYLVKKEDVQKRWYLIDAQDKVLGRLASDIATILMGKNDPLYTPHVDIGNYVVVVNVDKIRVTGRKAEQKMYKRYSRYPSGLRLIPFKDMMSQRPERVLQLAVKRMLPRNQMSRHALKKLRLFAGPEHTHSAQQPEKLEL